MDTETLMALAALAGEDRVDAPLSSSPAPTATRTDASSRPTPRPPSSTPTPDAERARTAAHLIAAAARRSTAAAAAKSVSPAPPAGASRSADVSTPTLAGKRAQRTASSLPAVMAPSENRSAPRRQKDSAIRGARERVQGSTKTSRRATPDAPMAETPPRKSDGRTSTRSRRSTRPLPAHIARLPEVLRWNPRFFREEVRQMTEADRASLRARVRAELRFAAQGRYSTEARSDIEKQCRFLLAILDDRFAVPPTPRTKKPHLQSTTTSEKKTSDEQLPTVRLRAARTFSPSPSKYLLRAYGTPVSGGLPSLGRRA